MGLLVTITGSFQRLFITARARGFGTLTVGLGIGGGIKGALPAVQPHRRATRSVKGLFTEYVLHGNEE
jgi:hypothetical protein